RCIRRFMVGSSGGAAESIASNSLDGDVDGFFGRPVHWSKALQSLSIAIKGSVRHGSKSRFNASRHVSTDQKRWPFGSRSIHEHRCYRWFARSGKGIVRIVLSRRREEGITGPVHSQENRRHKS